MDTQTQTTTLPPRTLGPYELLHEAGRGGMSTVYEARDTRIGRRVALKVVSIPGYLSAEMKQAQAARIKREARSIARLSHPNIVSVHDVGEQDGHHFIVMEFLDGQTLRARMNDGPPLSTADILHILEGVAGGLDAVHAQNVVHRDIKPSNVMLLPDGRVKLMDFGVARQVDDTMVTQAGTMVGSPAYMAPEQIEGQVPTPASDVWSLGALLYEMLAGHAPFTAKSIPLVMYQIAHNPPPPISDVSLAVQQTLNRALEKDPAKRFASAGELAYAFRRALQPDAAAATPPVRPLPAAARVPRPTPHLTLLPPRQARSLAGALAVLLVALLLGLATFAQRHRLVQPSPITLAQAAPHPSAAFLPSPPRIRIGSSLEQKTAPPAAPPIHHAAVVHHAAAVPHAAVVHRSVRHPRRAVIRPAMPLRRRNFRPVAYAPQPNSWQQPRPARREFRQIRRRLIIPARRKILVSPASSSHSSGSRDAVLGVWHGTHTRNPATLVINSRHGDAFAGTMTVRTHEATVRIAVDGQVSPRTGAVSMQERRVLWASKPRAWDLGRESGRMSPSGHITGSGTDVKGRVGDWSFSR